MFIAFWTVVNAKDNTNISLGQQIKNTVDFDEYRSQQSTKRLQIKFDCKLPSIEWINRKTIN